MADTSPSRDERGDETGGAAGEPTPGTPRWVKAFGLVALVVVLLFLVVLIVGGGEHGPGRHSPAGGTSPGSETPGAHTGPPRGFDHGDQRP
jgi:hypothetical protein